MATSQNTVTIARPADEVFAFLADFQDIPAWDPPTGARLLVLVQYLRRMALFGIPAFADVLGRALEFGQGGGEFLFRAAGRNDALGCGWPAVGRVDVPNISNQLHSGPKP